MPDPRETELHNVGRRVPHSVLRLGARRGTGRVIQHRDDHLVGYELHSSGV